MKLEIIKLVCLKEVFQQLKFLGNFGGIHIHQLNKFDLIVLLRNSGLIDESPPTYISYYNRGEDSWYKVYPSGRIFNKGEKIKSAKKTYGKIILDFN